MTVLQGDCNLLVPAEVLPGVDTVAPSFAFLDPTGLQLKWATVRALAAHRRGRYKMELLILYPFDMAIAFNLGNVGARQALTEFYGSDHWMQEYAESRDVGEAPAQRRDRFTALYVRNLKGLGYQHVAPYGPLKAGNRAKYHVIFASDNAVGAKIMHDVWSRPRDVPGEMLYRPLRRPAK